MSATLSTAQSANNPPSSRTAIPASLAHAHKREPGRPVFGEKTKHRDRLAANCVAALDRERDAPERPAAETARWLSGIQKYAPVLS
jgi:hypothetical protein